MFILRDNEEVDLTIEAVSAAGNPTTVESPSWTSSDESIVQVTPSDTDPNMAVARAVGALGTATVTLTADLELGEGVEEAQAVLDIEVVGGDAAVFNISAGQAREQGQASI